jgi:subtilisin family serine protease
VLCLKFKITAMSFYKIVIPLFLFFPVLSIAQNKPIPNRFYFFSPGQVDDKLNSIKSGMPALKSISRLPNSDVVVIELKNNRQEKLLKKIGQSLEINIRQDEYVSFACDSPIFVANDYWRDMGWWNSTNQNILKEKQLIDSIYLLLKANYWNSIDDSGEIVRISLTEIPNGNHFDWPGINNTYSYDYFRNGSIDYINATVHGSGTAAAIAKVNNATTTPAFNGGTAGISNINAPLIKNVGNATGGFVSYILAAMQSCINEAAATGEKRILSLSFLLTTGTDPNFDLMFSIADTSNKVLFLPGAGNDNLPIGATLAATHPSTLVVQGSDGKGLKASWSNYNAPISFNGVTTRGLDVSSNTNIVAFNGTSASTPHVAGAAHLLWSLFTNKTAGEIKAMLIDSLNTTTMITNPSGTRTPALRLGYLIQNLHFDIVHDYPSPVEISSNGGIINLNNSVYDIQGGTIGNPVFSYQQNQTGPWVQISGGILNKNEIGAGTHFLKLEFDILHRTSACTQIIRPITIVNTLSTTYTFTGTGNWSNPSNWAGNIVPPAVLPAGAEIIINPIANGECIVDVNQTIIQGARLTILQNKKLLVPGNLIVQ